MEQTSATRMNLLARKSQLGLAQQGKSLLSSKQEALMKEVMVLAEPLFEQHAELAESLHNAGRSLTFSEALDGRPYLRSLALVCSRKLRLEMNEERLWGVRVPNLHHRRTTARAADHVSDLTARAADTADDFAVVVEAILELASLHIRLDRLGNELRKTTRRVNALEQILIPRIEQEIKSIGQTLEEVEREDTFRLRRIKKKRERKSEAKP